MKLQAEFMTLMDNGGLIMWVIFMITNIVMIMLASEWIHGYFSMKRAKIDHNSIRNGGDWPQPENDNGSPIARLLTRVNWRVIQSKKDIAKEFNTHLMEIIPAMEGNLSTIAILGTLLPMLGLLGTVTGMINVFEVIALQGSGKPDEMAGGISQALLTTAAGLITAIPVIIFHHLLSRRANALMAFTQHTIQLVLQCDYMLMKRAYHNES